MCASVNAPLSSLSRTSMTSPPPVEEGEQAARCLGDAEAAFGEDAIVDSFDAGAEGLEA